jgi:pilus assembly protein Flp/PilA
MIEISQLAKHLIADESGQDLIEYALITALVGLAAVAILRTVATSIVNLFTRISSTLDSVSPPAS